MKNAAYFFTQISLLAAIPGLVQCQKEPEPTGVTQPVPRPSAPPVPAASAPAVIEPVASAEPAPSKDLGEWTESPSYKFRVTAIKRCSDPKAAGDAGDKSYQLGLFVQVYAKYDDLLVLSKDVKLESDGVILKSELDPKPMPGCMPGLPTKPLRHDQIASGVVIFTIPPEFDARAASAVYQATRWGGAPKAAFKLPECLDACEDRKPSRAVKAGAPAKTK